jgi:hypothetical protein
MSSLFAYRANTGSGSGNGSGNGSKGLIHDFLIRRIHDIYEKVFQFFPPFTKIQAIMTYFVTITLAEWGVVS